MMILSLFVMAWKCYAMYQKNMNKKSELTDNNKITKMK